MQQWTVGQIHDTVRAIASQRAYGSSRESLATKFFRLVFRWVGEVFSWLRGTLDAQIVIVIAVALIALIIVARIYIDRRYAAVRRRGLEIRGARGGRRDFWALARELATAGRYTDACHAVHAAVLEAMTGASLVRYHPSKTNGDYARELRRAGAPIAADFRAFGRDFDHVMYGHTAAAADDFQRLLAAAEGIARAVRQSRAA